MNIDECFELGYVIKPHGLDGVLDIFLDTDNPENYTELESVFVLFDQTLVPFFVEKIQVRGSKALLILEDIDSLDKARGLKGCKLYLPDSILPELEGPHFYYHEVLGFEVVDTERGALGKVKSFYDYPGQTLLAVDYLDHEVLIPVNDDVIIKIDRGSKTMKVDLPDGLIDVYLDS